MSYPAPHRWAVSRQKARPSAPSPRSADTPSRISRQLLQGGSQVVAAARAVLQDQAHARRRLVQHGGHVPRDQPQALRVPHAAVGADVGVDQARPVPRGALHLVDEPGKGLAGERLRGAGEVDEVAGVDGDGADPFPGGVGDERLGICRRLGAAPPGGGVVAEDLEGGGANLPGATSRLEEPGGDAQVNPHPGSARGPGEATARLPARLPAWRRPCYGACHGPSRRAHPADPRPPRCRAARPEPQPDPATQPRARDPLTLALYAFFLALIAIVAALLFLPALLR